MSGSDYINQLRSKVGNTVLLLPCVAAVILDGQNRILLQEKADEPWSLPAGMIEPGESPGEAVAREIEEETGLIVKPEKVLGIFGGDTFRYKYPNGDLVEYTLLLMRCAVLSDTGLIVDTETKSLEYFEKHLMPELALPYPKEVLFDELSETFIL